jgi:hypothetical protein
MGSPNGRYLSGYYSFWLYIDEGFTPGLTGSDDWMTILNWFSGAPINPILNIELRRPPGQRLAPLQLVFLLKNAHTGCYAAPQISGYNLVGGAYYFMTAASPAGIVEFPRFQWVHVEIYYKMASSNGQVTIWQDGVKIMDMTHSNLNTLIASSNCANTAGDMFPQFGMYSGPRTEVQRFYLDDFKVSDVRLSPSGTGSSIALPAPSSLQVQ